MKFCDLWLLYTVHYILSSSKIVGGINFKAGNQWVASWSSNTPVPVKNGFVEVARWLILGHMMRFSLQSSLAMPTTRLIFLFFLLILPNNSSTYQRRRKPVCPKAFHLIGINCADKKTTKYHRSCSGGKCYYYAGFKLNWFRAIQVKLFIWIPNYPES